MTQHKGLNFTTKCVPPNMAWASNDIGTVEENIEAFNKMTKQEQGFFIAVFEATMMMQGIEPPRGDTDLRKLYYAKSIKSD